MVTQSCTQWLLSHALNGYSVMHSMVNCFVRIYIELASKVGKSQNYKNQLKQSLLF